MGRGEEERSRGREYVEKMNRADVIENMCLKVDFGYKVGMT